MAISLRIDGQYGEEPICALRRSTKTRSIIMWSLSGSCLGRNPSQLTPPRDAIRAVCQFRSRLLVNQFFQASIYPRPDVVASLENCPATR